MPPEAASRSATTRTGREQAVFGPRPEESAHADRQDRPPDRDPRRDYCDARWTGRTTAGLFKKEAARSGASVDDLVATLVDAGCVIHDIAEYPGGHQVLASPSPCVHATLLGSCHIDGRPVHSRGGPAGAIGPWADADAVHHLDDLLDRHTPESRAWGRKQARLAVVGEGPSEEVDRLEAMGARPDAKPAAYLRDGADEEGRQSGLTLDVDEPGSRRRNPGLVPRAPARAGLE